MPKVPKQKVLSVIVDFELPHTLEGEGIKEEG
jgi:hypothetical protein